MKVAATPPIDHLVHLEPVSLHVAGAGVAATPNALRGVTPAAALVPRGEPSGTIDLSPMGRTVAALAAFGPPVVLVRPEGGGQPPQEGAEPALPGLPRPAAALESKPAASSQHIARTLAESLSLPPAGVSTEGAAVPKERRPADEAAMQKAARSDRPEGPRPPAQQAAGSLLNALLCAALTGQTAVEVRRWDGRPLQLELQREPDGHGGFRITRVRIRHQTDQGFLKVSAETGLPGCERAPMLVDIASSESLADEVAARLDDLRGALSARGLAPSVRSRQADAPSA
ncbi:hypothetical protein [Azohydromonas caseinilytica]|uniref:Uncharacterized protein n=1 Tax=Azohydromonas caseinilytica TaxID=2728836 RepID=A0A848FEQ5_9BURK|nr:hypothetical protein [Azohydromonas caseinilytica]NML16630.1 hypothetical protein [Azohydromonas caseinilytica]